ncbi:MAG: helix-turn-helix domain-containing protein [Niameybacter sp.]|uniref:TrmB family transcriptional regulator n=1 Tax=Niameybacter sp. TaxID=2033640 RepID=UPI002FC86DBB
MHFEEALTKLGLTPIEATLYTTLCKNGALTGYEVAKLCGISRSNVYAGLYSLQEKGKCYLLDEEPNKYIALPKEDLLRSAQKDFSKVYETLETLYPESLLLSDPYITIKGYQNVVDKITNTILDCKSHLYILTTSDILEQFQAVLSEISTSKRVTIICDSHLIIGEALIHTKAKPILGFHMIMDTHCVITGDLSQESSQCLFTTNQSLVRLMRESLITELEMIRLTNH